ncbi:MAG: pyridoxamine 5'-phosphate oxidase [Bdellovibrionaceae bacterium]|nr:pyridoxamine 5'-phosphate oxidase [Pseudobdellovibrionaceae bacterium]
MSQLTPDIFPFDQDPFDLFLQELKAAEDAGMKEPNAMTLATVSAMGQPRARTVFFKGYSDGENSKGFRFFTNYDSDKANEMSRGRAGLLFHWNLLERQVRIEGRVEKTSREESEAYFRTRPRISQLGAWSSEQSREIPNHKWLEDRFESFEAKFAGGEVPCPPHWGGYRVIPLEFEFWIARAGRMHERYVYQRLSDTDGWRRFMRSP